jgi:hypothetical protein
LHTPVASASVMYSSRYVRKRLGLEASLSTKSYRF